MKSNRVVVYKQRKSHGALVLHFGVNMGSHALNSVIVMMLLLGVSTTTEPIMAEKCQNEPETGPGCEELCSLKSYVQNMVQNINTCLNQTTAWVVSGTNPVILVPQTDSSTQGSKKGFTWRRIEIGPLAPGHRNVCRIRCITSPNKDKTGVLSVKNLGQNQENTRHRQNKPKGNRPRPEIKQAESNTRPRQAVMDELSKGESLHDQSKSNSGFKGEGTTNTEIQIDQTKTTPPPSVHEDTATGTLETKGSNQRPEIKKPESERPPRLAETGKPSRSENQPDPSSSIMGEGRTNPEIQIEISKNTTPPSEHEDIEKETICVPHGDIILYNPHCTNSNSRKQETPNNGETDDKVVLKCSTNVPGVCPGVNVLHCLACMQSEQGNGNVHALNNSKYSEESKKITIAGHSDHKIPLTEHQIEQLRQLKFPYDVQSLMRSKEKPIVVHVEDKLSKKIPKYVIVENTGQLMVGVPYNEHEGETTTTKKTTTPPPSTTTTTTLPPSTTTTTTLPPSTTTTKTLPPSRHRSRLTEEKSGGRCRASFAPATGELFGRRPSVNGLEPPVYVPREVVLGRTLFPHCLEPLTNAAREPLKGDFRSQGVPDKPEHLSYTGRFGTTKNSSPRGSYCHTAEIPKNTMLQFQKEIASTERPSIYNGCCCRNNNQYGTNSRFKEDGQPGEDDCEYYLDYEDFEKAETSPGRGYNARQWPQSWNMASNSRSTAIAPKSTANHYQEAQNRRQHDDKQFQMNPGYSNSNVYHQKPTMPDDIPYHYQMTQQGNARHTIVNREPHDSFQVHQKRENFRPAKMPKNHSELPQNYNSATSRTYSPKTFHQDQNFNIETSQKNHASDHYMNHATNKVRSQRSGFRTSVSEPTYLQKQQTWGQNIPTPNDGFCRYAIPPRQYERTPSPQLYQRPLAGYSKSVCNPLMQAPFGYTNN